MAELHRIATNCLSGIAGRACATYCIGQFCRAKVIPAHRAQQQQSINEGTFEMICTPKHVGALGILVAPILLVFAAPVFAQAPTDAQRNAIRSACRSDYMAHCSSVPPGGAESLQCLQKNMSSLSSSCQTAVRAVEPAAPPKAEAAPKAEPPKAEAAPKAETPKAEAAPKPETAPKAASAPVKQTAEPA